MSGTVPKPLWKKLAIAARQERNPTKFMYLVKQLYDLLNYGEEAEGPDSGAASEAVSALTRAAVAAPKRRAA